MKPIKKGIMSENLVLTSVTLDELCNKVAERVLQLKESNPTKVLDSKEGEIVSRENAAKMLGITLPTLRRYTVEGLIPSYRIGSRVRYKKSEILDSLKATTKRK
jgi:excisionase family DNA binding protein